MTMSENTSSVTNMLEKKCRCLFCGAEFQAKDIEFYVTTQKEIEFYDMKYENHISQYKGIENTEAPYRVEIEWADDPEHCVIIWDESGLPETVRGTIKIPEGYTSQSSMDSLGFGGLFSTGENEEENKEIDDDGNIISESSQRVCPECHMTLMKGFNTDKIIRVGLVGGMRSGKTTFMIVASKYLEKRFEGEGDIDFHLGNVRLTPESKKFVDELYTNGIHPTFKSSAGLKMQDPPVLPVIMRIIPNDKTYRPFILILQDIPGEYMNPDIETEELLACSEINKSTDLIMFVDSNHFVTTWQKDPDKNTGSQYGDYCNTLLNDLFQNYEVLGGRLNTKSLKSIQIAITKLDFLIEADQRLKAAVFSKSGDACHKDTISEKRLNAVNMQIKSVLGSQKFGGYGCGDLIEKITNPMNASPDTKRFYTAVASKYVPGNTDKFDGSGIDVHYEYSLNVLEPLLNIFASHHLLPVMEEEYVKAKN